jgi:DNA-directed RNA polymerase subunit RPC12/RpoP
VTTAWPPKAKAGELTSSAEVWAMRRASEPEHQRAGRAGVCDRRDGQRSWRGLPTELQHYRCCGCDAVFGAHAGAGVQCPGCPSRYAALVRQQITFFGTEDTTWKLV